VIVTDSYIMVKETLYQLNGITRHNFLIVHPDKRPAFFMLVMSVVILALGFFQQIPKSLIQDVDLYSVAATANTIAIGIGIILLIVGSLVIVQLKDRYAVSICTAEGEKKVIVSPRKEYITQIVDALNRAFFNLVVPPDERVRSAEKNKILREIFRQKLYA